VHVGLLIYGNLENQSGGYLYDLKLVETLQAGGDQVSVVSLPWRGYPAHLLDNWDKNLFRRLQTLAVDVLLQDELNHPSLFRLNRRLRAVIRYPIVGIVHHLRSSERHPWPLRLIYRQIERQYLATVDAFIFNSSTTRAAVSALLDQPAPGVVAMPAGDHLCPPSAEDVERMIVSRCSSGGPLRILFVGNVIPRKGLDDLVSALAILPRDVCRLDVVGSLEHAPGYVKRVFGRITNAHLGDRITFWGRVSDSELRKRLAASHVLAVPSYEGFGIVYLEAMSFGLPVIASTQGAAREIVSHGRTGFLVSPRKPQQIARHLLWLHEDLSRLASFSRSARHYYEKHPGWAESMAKIPAYLHSLSAPARPMV
jgi:glycosyltransferase involved in cell wall biosynthesis